MLKNQASDTALKVEVTDRDDRKHEVLWTVENSLMECIRDRDLPIAGTCGGNGVCGTCHVYVDPQSIPATGARSSEELELLESSLWFKPEASRLSCQIRHSPALAGIKVTLAPYD